MNQSPPTANPPAPYPELPVRPDFAALERQVLDYWRADDTFAASIEQRSPDAEFVFYDGPPFANGLPHYGHLLTGYVKDVVPRYWTMRGRRVERRFGWDCHGLPAELEAEKSLGVSGRAAVETFGVGKFNAHCAKSVLRYTEEWKRYVTRQGRWVDFEHGYRTMDLSYMESVIWAFRKLYEKGLVYESYKVMPYSWAAETPLSNFELRLDDSYRLRRDRAVTLEFRLLPEPGDELSTSLWAWTTTPWTLPANLALAVGEEVEYAVYERASERWILAADAEDRYQKELASARRVGTRRGHDFVGRRYAPLWPFFENHAGAFRVLAADFVETDSGTGVVHLAPGFGEDDQRVCQAAGIELVCPVDDRGRYTSEVVDWENMQVLEANPHVVERLREDGRLVREEEYEHSYPHCWRTDQPLIYRAVRSWFVRVTALRERLLELNRRVHWVPEHVRDGQFGTWLENVRDWAISRNRFWGAPVPVWKSDDPRYPRVDVYGSLAELERDFGQCVHDLHRPHVDQLTRQNPDDPTGLSRMHRVQEVLDCWFESGAMPFAQVHYPFEKQAWFEAHFPADFVVEYMPQTRGWFYTMTVLAAALFDRPAFEHCVCHGIVLDTQGKKLSKKLGNYPDPLQVCESHGSDALRWFLVSSSVVRGQNLVVDERLSGVIEALRTVLTPLYNAQQFFTLYANLDGVRAEWRTDSEHVLDRYVLSELCGLVTAMQAAFDAYDLAEACQHVVVFVETLTNWYVRRSRSRFWREGMSLDKRGAYDTLFTVLCVLCRVTAPLLPFLSETLYRNLTGERSVHLTDWPDASALPDHRDVVESMRSVRAVCSATLSLREAHRLRTRLPLRALTVAGSRAQELAAYSELIADEVNVKSVVLHQDENRLMRRDLRLNFRKLGPKLGQNMQAVAAAVRSGDFELLAAGRARVAGFELEPDEFELSVGPAPGVVGNLLASEQLLVVLDVTLTPELEREGLVRDLVRVVQEARKRHQLHVSDRVRLVFDAPLTVTSAARAHLQYLADQTLAVDVSFDAGADVELEQVTVAGMSIGIAVLRAEV